VPRRLRPELHPSCQCSCTQDRAALSPAGPAAHPSCPPQVRINQASLIHLPEILLSMPQDRIVRMQKRIGRIWHRCARPPATAAGTPWQAPAPSAPPPPPPPPP
jgi:hypothetical protein